MAAVTRQPREHPAPCFMCGLDARTRKPRKYTWNTSSLCDDHEAERSTIGGPLGEDAER